MAPIAVNARVQKHRHAPCPAGFPEECRRQSRLVAEADMADPEMQRFMDQALAEIDGWTG